MVEAPGIRVPFVEAEATRRQLLREGVLRNDLHPIKEASAIVFPATEGPEHFSFEPRNERAAAYQDLLPITLQPVAPRAFEALGDIGILKIPDELWAQRETIGAALQSFLRARAVFHDEGVTGTYRVRKLVRIAGEGGSETTIQENGVKLHVDVAKAYFSPRLADERGRIATLIAPGEHVVDMFGGVAPLGVQAAKAGARATSNDLNPAAHELAIRNAAANNVDLALHCGDARNLVGAIEPADRIVMNLPHGAKDFLDEAVALAAPGGTIHLHEILANDDIDARRATLSATVGRVSFVRHVRNYSAHESHVCFDIQVPT